MFSCLCVHACTYGGLGPPCVSMLGLFLCGNLSLAWNLPSRLGWPTRPLGFSCLRFPSTGITSECQHACLPMPLLLIKFMSTGLPGRCFTDTSPESFQHFLPLLEYSSGHHCWLTRKWCWPNWKKTLNNKAHQLCSLTWVLNTVIYGLGKLRST